MCTAAAAADRSSFDEAARQFLSGLPLSGVVCVELFAGSARLTSSLGREGFDSFGVDHVVSKQASGSILQLDLNDPQSVEHLWRIISDPAVKYIHCAPPCGTAARSEWRTSAEARYSDSGGTVICLDMVDLRQQPISSLQSCVQAWHRRGYALAESTRSVVLQLGRFTHNAGRVVKNTSAVGWETGRINLPAFRDDAHIDTRWSTFCITAIIVHIGSRPDSGHYRTLVPLLGEGELSHAQSTHVYAADDNRAAECLDLELHPQLLEQAYLFFLRAE